MPMGSTPPTVSDNVGSQAAHPPTQNELLCFIRQKSMTMTVDDIGKICTDFYKEDEIFAAKSLLEQVLPFRLSKRQGSNKCRATVDDMIRTVLDPNIVLPVYYAIDLTRIPPVDSDHCNVAAILTELQGLRAEVRAVKQLSDEVTALREEVKQLRQLKSQVATVCQDFAPLSDIDVTQLRDELNALKSTMMSYPPLPVAVDSGSHVAAARHVPDDQNESSAKSFAGFVRNLPNAPLAFTNRQQKQIKKPVIGKSLANKSVKSVTTIRTVDIFV